MRYTTAILMLAAVTAAISDTARAEVLGFETWQTWGLSDDPDR